MEQLSLASVNFSLSFIKLKDITKQLTSTLVSLPHFIKLGNITGQLTSTLVNLPHSFIKVKDRKDLTLDQLTSLYHKIRRC